MENNAGLLEEAFRLQVAVNSGIINDITSEELEILTIMHRDQPLMEAKTRADLIAASVSKIFGSSEPQ